jgi:hypothetical protein
MAVGAGWWWAKRLGRREGAEAFLFQCVLLINKNAPDDVAFAFASAVASEIENVPGIASAQGAEIGLFYP